MKLKQNNNGKALNELNKKQISSDLNKFLKELIKEEQKGIFPNLKLFFESNKVIKNFSEIDDEEIYYIYNFQSSFVKNFIRNSYNYTQKSNKNNFINIFYRQTERINFIIFTINAMFQYLNNNISNKNLKTITANGLELYKKEFFEPLLDKLLL